jgi:hypothetical protein
MMRRLTHAFGLAAVLSFVYLIVAVQLNCWWQSWWPLQLEGSPWSWNQVAWCASHAELLMDGRPQYDLGVWALAFFLASAYRSRLLWTWSGAAMCLVVPLALFAPTRDGRDVPVIVGWALTSIAAGTLVSASWAVTRYVRLGRRPNV